MKETNGDTKETNEALKGAERMLLTGSGALLFLWKEPRTQEVSRFGFSLKNTTLFIIKY